MSGHFEAKKHAYRQTQDGIVISFTCHPNDVSAEMALAALGTRYMVAFSEIGDDEKPLGAEVARKSDEETHGVDNVAGERPAGQAKDRRPFSSLPLSQQAAIRCQDVEFRFWLRDNWQIGDGYIEPNSERAADFVRTFCNVDTRAKLDTETGPAERWKYLELQWQMRLTDKRYAEAMR